MNFTRTVFAALLLVLVGLAGSQGKAQPAAPAQLSAPAPPYTSPPSAFPLSGDVGGTHDPSIAVDHGTYYVFATGAAYAPRPAGMAAGERPPVLGQLAIRCSTDLLQWSRCGQVFSAIPAWIQQMSPQTKDLWAPDVSYFDGVYHLYYAFSLFGKNTSGIALATNKTLDPQSPKYQWIDRGLVVRSTADDNFNAIDPNLILDDQGRAWLSFGSFWSGIKMRRLDRKTGLLSPQDSTTYSLAARANADANAAHNADLPPNTQAIEAPFLFKHGDYFYLFVSWDLCCRGLKSTYRTMVGRAKQVTGPYVDRDGRPMLEGGGTPVLSANQQWLGPGGESLLHLPGQHAPGQHPPGQHPPGQDLLVFHAYSAIDGKPSLQISSLGWVDGWPSAALQSSPGSR